jgi:hypothetical protein
MTCLHHPADRFDRTPPFHGGWRGAQDRRWHPVELTAMIVGFVLFWPIGLAILAWKKWMGTTAGGRPSMRPLIGPGDTGNSAFEDYKSSELARLEEERRRLFEAQEQFAAHLDRLKRARDRAEFDQFMAERKASGGTSGT